METLLIIIVVYGIYHFVVGSIINVHHNTLWDMRIYELKSKLLDVQIKNGPDSKLILYRHLDGLLDFIAKHKEDLNFMFLRQVAKKLERNQDPKRKELLKKIESTDHQDLKEIYGLTKELIIKITLSNLLRWPLATILIIVPLSIFRMLFYKRTLKESNEAKVDKFASIPNADLESYANRLAYI